VYYPKSYPSYHPGHHDYYRDEYLPMLEYAFADEPSEQMWYLDQDYESNGQYLSEGLYSQAQDQYGRSYYEE